MFSTHINPALGALNIRGRLEGVMAGPLGALNPLKPLMDKISVVMGHLDPLEIISDILTYEIRIPYPNGSSSPRPCPSGYSNHGLTCIKWKKAWFVYYPVFESFEPCPDGEFEFLGACLEVNWLSWTVEGAPCILCILLGARGCHKDAHPPPLFFTMASAL